MANNSDRQAAIDYELRTTPADPNKSRKCSTCGYRDGSGPKDARLAETGECELCYNDRTGESDKPRVI